MSTATTDIRTEADWDRFCAELREDIERVSWGEFITGEHRQLEKLHAGFFSASAGPDGTPWKPNAASTIKAKGHSRILRGKLGTALKPASKGAKRFYRRYGKARKGAFPLMRSLTMAGAEHAIREGVDNWPDLVEVFFGTDLPYSAWNQDGTRTIPARPHVGLTEQYLDGAQDRAVDYVVARVTR